METRATTGTTTDNSKTETGKSKHRRALMNNGMETSKRKEMETRQQHVSATRTATDNGKTEMGKSKHRRALTNNGMETNKRNSVRVQHGSNEEGLSGRDERIT